MNYFKELFSHASLFWKESNYREKLLSFVFILVLIVGFLSISIWTYPGNFPIESTIEIPSGATLIGTAKILDENYYIRSQFWFRVFVTMLGGSNRVIAGDYFFDKKESVVDVAWRITRGDYGLTQLRVTIPEGLDNKQVAEIIKKQFSLFDVRQFVERGEQGKLFPDTYFFLPNVTAESVISRMMVNFDEKIKTISSDLASSTRPFDQVLIMASILEEEAKTIEDRKMIADILWRRLDMGMALQVDSAMETYDRRGLPDKPISNPGLEAVLDAIHLTKNKYLYFLSDKQGKFHYAKDFDEHQRNRELYFKK
jgi:UPF0755 protein